MPTWNGTNSSETIDLTNEHSRPPKDWPATQAWWVVNAKGGNDLVYGSAYSDLIYGGAGIDRLYGYNGRDTLEGGSSDDRLYGGNGDDTLRGGADDDQLYGESGDDFLLGESGIDKLFGGDGDDFLSGGSGNDILRGETGKDFLYGDAGADTIIGGAGSDQLFGDAGNDTYVFDGTGYDVVNDGVTATGSPRTGGVYDTNDQLKVSYFFSDIYYKRSGNDLILYSHEDEYSDGSIDSLVKIRDFYKGGHYVVETLITGDGFSFDLTLLLDA